MKATTIVLLFLFVTTRPSAQYISTDQFSITDVSSSYFLKSGSETILLYPFDPNISSQIWTTFDSTLQAVSKKKLVTPNAHEIINQTYFESFNSITRIDQWINDNELHISVYIFDSRGNIIVKKEINDTIAAKQDADYRLLPFTVSQSADKKLVALTRSAIKTENELAVETIIFNTNIDVIKRASFRVDFNPDLLTQYLPVLSNEGTYVFVTTDKYNSYKLNTAINTYKISLENEAVKKNEFIIARKKIKHLSFNITDNKFVYSALVTQPLDKKNIAGIIYSVFDYATEKHLYEKEYIYPKEIKKELKKVYGLAVKTEQILNHLTLLSKRLDNFDHSYGVLKAPIIMENMPLNKPDQLPFVNPNEVQNSLAYVNSYVGTAVSHSGKPMNFSEASAFAATQVRPNDADLASRQIKDLGATANKLNAEKSQPKNLLYFSFKDSLQLKDHQFIKLKAAIDENYSFISYFSLDNAYTAVYYTPKTFGLPYLKRTSIDRLGNISEKKLLEDNTKIIPSGYPSVVNNGRLISFYEDRNTEKFGLISIEL